MCSGDIVTLSALKYEQWCSSSGMPKLLGASSWRKLVQFEVSS